MSAVAADFETLGDAHGLVELLLREQEQLTAVERFSRQHEPLPRPATADTSSGASSTEATAGPAQARYYRDLIPATPPGPGEQYAFRVDLDACTGCKACVTACHSLNGLEPDETWRDVGLLTGGVAEEPVHQTVTTACHHCEDPACLSGCPVRAYEKDPVTGIVRHLDDQCIGCQYCVLKCPYDVPKYSVKLGIVRKCDMCSDRLAVGEAPACVQGCPNQAISIDRVAVGAAPDALLPAVPGTLPGSSYTRPTTRYVTQRSHPPLRPADELRVEPADPHHPLAGMLVFSQLSVGVLFIEVILAAFGQAGSPARAATAALAAVLGLGVANLHLGRPHLAFRAILGLMTSWMSREIVALGAFAGAAVAFAASVLTPLWLPELVAGLPAFVPPLSSLAPWLGLGAALAGGGAVFCSVMIYADTRRPSWHFARTAPLFFATTLVLGLAASAATGVWVEGLSPATLGLLAFAWGAALFGKLGWEPGSLDARNEAEEPGLARGRAVLAGPLAGLLRARRACGLLGAVFALALCFASLAGLPGVWLATLAAVALALTFAGESLERHLFFTACLPRAMPGGA